MSERPEDETYVERVPIPLDQPTIAWLAWLERTTGEPAAKIAGRFLRDARDEFGHAAGAPTTTTTSFT
jgi:hypothetical protein